MPGDANRVRLSQVKEVTYGTTPSSPLKEIRLLRESLKQSTTWVRSTQIRNDRQVVGVKRTDIKAEGGIEFELSYGDFDDHFEQGLMSSAWSAVVTQTKTVYSFASGDNSINDSGNNFVTNGYLADYWVKISGAANAANNGYFKAVSVAAGKIVLAGGTLVTESAGASITLVQGARVKNGTTITSYSIEREYRDLTTELTAYTGMVIDQLSLSGAVGQLWTGSLTYIGKKEESKTATIGNGSYTAASGNAIMNSVDDINKILENATAIVEVLATTLQLNNNLRGRTEMAKLGVQSVGSGTCDLTGTLRTYFSTKTLFDKYLNFTETGFAIVLKDPSGNAYVVDIPKMNFTDGQRVTGGENTDIIAELSFQAFRHPTQDMTIQIARFPGP